jgi:hypothetical protein
MQRRSLMRRCRSATWKTWLGTALAVWLLLAESFAVTHPFDQAAHADGQPCAVCLGLADLGAGAAAADVGFALADAATPLLVAVAIVFLLSSAPVRAFARGPPSVSFAS